MQLWFYQNQYRNMDRIVRILEEEGVHTIVWMNELNNIEKLDLRHEEWEDFHRNFIGSEP
ncbi:MAG: hypothetical protein K0S45_1795 [Nitrospira sp.]|nr:hypothetical protein [Nitrospira sp.]